jgi:DNA (cytosine-5)-methyltransferase 1
MGYHRAGFDVVGVDINSEPRYPFEFHQADALEYLVSYGSEFDAIHASPPCHDHSRLYGIAGGRNGTGWLLAATREALRASGMPSIIENVPGAAMRTDFRLCGCMFGLPGLRRERWFETSWHGFDFRAPCSHSGPIVTVAGHTGGSSVRDGLTHGSLADWRKAMGIDWMTARELAQAIPPAYTQLIGEQLLAHLAVAA